MKRTKRASIEECLLTGSPAKVYAGSTRRLVVPAELTELERYHRGPIYEFFGFSQPQIAINPTLKFLFICFTNRCGSNYLTHLIASTKVLNQAGEFFNAPTVINHARRHSIVSLHDYLNLLGSQLSMSGWLLSKIGIEQLIMLTECGILDQIIGRTKFILIERQDRLAQAVSRLVAVQNQQWTSEQEPAVPDSELVYSRQSIDEHKASIDWQNHCFYRYFATNNITPNHISYEDLTCSPQRNLRQITAWIGLEELAGQPSAVRITQQQGDIKRAWLKRYRTESY